MIWLEGVIYEEVNARRSASWLTDNVSIRIG